MKVARIVLLIVIALAPACRTQHETARRRGAFAFHYGPSLTAAQIDWYSQFDILVTHDPLPEEQVRQLRAAGTSLVLYEWAVAFYDSLATEWQRSLLASKAGLLNSSPLTGGLGSATSGAWYFDPAAPSHRDRAAVLAKRIAAAGYQGVFLDTTTEASVHPTAAAEFSRRHPATAYDAAYSAFLGDLRRELGAGIIFTNQGYRSAQYYLPHVDWDLTESLMTRPQGSVFVLRPWNDRKDPWNSISFLMRNLIGPIAARHPNVRFGHLNYVGGAAPETINVVHAIASIFDSDAFVSAPELEDEVSTVYFRDPGTPLSRRMDAADESASWRFFEHALIAVSASRESVEIANPHRHRFRSRETNELFCGEIITLPPTSGSPRAFFFDSTSDCG